jgi:hypothetical protein
MRTAWRTVWQGPDIIVYRDDLEVDRVSSEQIRRVIFVHQGSGDSLGDLAYAIVELSNEYVILPDYTGFAGRVNFERHAFWAERGCVYWIAETHAVLPASLRRGRRLLRQTGPEFARVPRAELEAAIASWPLDGPQTWEQRKWRRIEDGRPFTSTAPGRLRA